MFASRTLAFGLRFLNRLMFLALISLIAGWGTSKATAETLFFDDFEDGKISKDFKLDALQGSPGKPELKVAGKIWFS